MRVGKRRLVKLAWMALLALPLHAQGTIDVSPHRAQMISVEKDVSLEVLDWGGTGRPLLLLAGLGDSAHVFDEFAPKLTATHHVYGLSRRGRGASSKPEANATNYAARRLGEDVLAVMEALHLERPIVAGHSFAGEELSYLGTYHPEKVAGLVYMEAGYSYALYDQARGELELDAIDLRHRLNQFTHGYSYEPLNDFDALIATLDRVKSEVERQEQETRDLPPTPVSPRMTPDLFAIMEGRERFTMIHAPALVIFATVPIPESSDAPQSRAEAVRQGMMLRDKERQIAAWKRQVPSADLVMIPHATHSLFQSHGTEVVRAIEAFSAGLR